MVVQVAVALVESTVVRRLFAPFGAASGMLTRWPTQAFMELQPISLETLSGIRHSASLPPHERFSQPEFLHVAFRGDYRSGAEGKPDALYITSTIAALDTAWYSKAFIIDLTDLKYDWGDEMSWVRGIGWQPTFRAHRPLAVIVGDQCRAALQTLDPDQYQLYAVESFDDALGSIRRQKPDRGVRLVC